MTCLLAGIFATVFWPAQLMTVCYYKCPTLDYAQKYVRIYLPYGAYCPANKIVGK
jgi:hypothetical protein